MQALLNALRNPQMGGMAGDAQQKLTAMDAFKKYQAEAMSQGKQPVPLDQFMQGQR